MDYVQIMGLAIEKMITFRIRVATDRVLLYSKSLFEVIVLKFQL